MPPISGKSSPDDDKVCIDRKTFMHLLGLVCRSTDLLVNARHREIFLDSLNTYLIEATELDGAGCFRASLFLNSYCEYVLPSLASLDDNLQELFDLMREIKERV